MNNITELLGVVLSSFIIGAIPLVYLAFVYMDKQTLVLVKTRKNPVSNTYIFPYLIIPVLIAALGLLKGVGIVIYADYVLGKSDFSLLIGAAGCLVGNLFTYSIIRKRVYFSSLCVWGIFIYFNPYFAMIVFVMGFIVYLFTTSYFAAQLGMIGFFIIYNIISNAPLSYFGYSVLVLIYLFIKNIDKLNRIDQIFDKNIRVKG